MGLKLFMDSTVKITFKVLMTQTSYMVEREMIPYKVERVQTLFSVRMATIFSLVILGLILYSVVVETRYMEERETIIFMVVLTLMFLLGDLVMMYLIVLKELTLSETLIQKKIQQVLTVSY